MTTVVVPFHLDERLPSFTPPVPVDLRLDPVLPTGTPWEQMAVLQERVAAAVADIVRGGGVPVVVSGDCVTALGTVAGLQRAGLRPGTVWFDGHGDVQTPQTSTSGYLGGMPVRQLLGGADRLVPDRLGLIPLAEPDVVLVDARDLDPPEAQFLAGSAVRRVPIGSVPDPDGPVYLHLDVDVLDAAELPGALFPVPGGPSAAATADALSGVLATGRVVAAGIACTWRPDTGSEQVVEELFALLTGR